MTFNILRRTTYVSLAILALTSVPLVAGAATHRGADPLAARSALPHVATKPKAPAKVVIPTSTPVASFTTSIWGYSSAGGKKLKIVNSKWQGSPLITPIILQSKGYDKIRLPSRPDGSTI